MIGRTLPFKPLKLPSITPEEPDPLIGHPELKEEAAKQAKHAEEQIALTRKYPGRE